MLPAVILTLLAKGSKYALVGDNRGEIFRVLLSSLPALEERVGGLLAPTRHLAPPLDAPRVAGYTAIVDRGIPPEVVVRFRYHICPVSLLRIYYIFEEGRRLWHLRELRGKDGKGTGNYHTEGGDYEPPLITQG